MSPNSSARLVHCKPSGRLQPRPNGAEFFRIVTVSACNCPKEMIFGVLYLFEDQERTTFKVIRARSVYFQ